MPVSIFKRLVVQWLTGVHTMEFDDRPIGLFDSGIGGLTVLKPLLSQLPNESFVYLGDTARLPYGNKSVATIERYLGQNISFLKSIDVKAIVVACNSASTVLIGRNQDFGVPVYNVIEPGAEAAIKATRGKRVGVLGTRATVAAQSYVNVLKKLGSPITVTQQACPLLVPLVEEGWEDDPLTNLVIYRYLQPLLQAGIDTLILGCTHYPALRGGISRVVGPNVPLIDSAQAILELLIADLDSGRMKKSSRRKNVRFLTTDLSPGLIQVASRMLRPEVLPPVESVDIGTITDEPVRALA